MEYGLILDIVPALAGLYLGRRMPEVRLSPLQCAILLAVGCQHRTFDQVAKDLDAPASQLLALFNKAMHKLANHCRALLEKDAEAEEEQEAGGKKVKSLKSGQVMAGGKVIKESLQQAQQDSAKKVNKKLEAARQELLASLKDSARRETLKKRAGAHPRARRGDSAAGHRAMEQAARACSPLSAQSRYLSACVSCLLPCIRAELGKKLRSGCRLGLRATAEGRLRRRPGRGGAARGSRRPSDGGIGLAGACARAATALPCPRGCRLGPGGPTLPRIRHRLRARCSHCVLG